MAELDEEIASCEAVLARLPVGSRIGLGIFASSPISWAQVRRHREPGGPGARCPAV